MSDSFSSRLARFDNLQEEFAELLVSTSRRQLRDVTSRPCWIQVDSPPGHGKTAILLRIRKQLEAAGSERQICAWVEADPAIMHRQILSALAADASFVRRLELRFRIVLAAAPGILAQRYLPASLLVLAILLVLSDPRSLSPWGFLLAGLVAVVSVVAAWTGRQAPLRLARPALRRACLTEHQKVSIVLDDLEQTGPATARRCLDDLRALTSDLPVAVYVGCDRKWLSAIFPQFLQADPVDPGSAPAAFGRYFDLSITVPQHWKKLILEKVDTGTSSDLSNVESTPPRLLLRHRLATAVLVQLYEACGVELTVEAVSRWSLICLRWPRLAEFLSTYPARIAHFRYEQQPPEASPDIATYFTDPQVVRLLRPEDEKVVLDEATLRLLLAPFPARRLPVA